MADVIQRYRLDAKDNTKAAFRSANRGVSSLGRKVAGLATAYLTLSGAIAGVSKLVRVTADYQNFANRLKLVSDNSKALAKNQKDLFAIAQRTRVAFGGSVELFTRMSLATQHLGFDGERLKGVLETVNQTVAISGSSAQAATAGLIQFSQGLASNRLGGEELRSVMEQIPPLGYAIAEGMGVTIGEFRKLSKEGKLTAEVVIKAIEKMKNKVQNDFDKTAVTIDHAYTRLANTLGRLFGENSPLGDVIVDLLKSLNKEVQKLQEYLDGFSAWEMDIALDKIKNAVISVIAVLALKKGASLVWAFGSATTAAKGLRAVVASIGKIGWVAALTAAAWAIYEIIELVEGRTKPLVERFRDAEEKAIAIQEQINKLLEQGAGPDNEYLKGYREALAETNKEAKWLNTQMKEAARVAKEGSVFGGPNQAINSYKPKTGGKKTGGGITQPGHGLYKLGEDGNVATSDNPDDFPIKISFKVSDEEREMLDAQLATVKERISGLSDAAMVFSTDEFGTTASPFGAEALETKIQQMLEAGEIEKETAVQLLEDINQAKFDTNQKWIDLHFKQKEKANKEALENTAETSNAELKWEDYTGRAKMEIGYKWLKDISNILANHSRAAFNIKKTSAIAEAIVSTYQGAANALSKGDFPFNIIKASLVAASGFAKVQAIRSTSYGGGGGSAGGGGGSAGGAVAGPTPGTGVTTATNATNVASGLETEPRDAINISIEGEGEMSFERVAMLIKQIDGARHDGMTSNIRLVGA